MWNTIPNPLIGCNPLPNPLIGCNPSIKPTGPFQRHVCDQKKWKISLLNGYSSWYKHAINKFWLIIVYPVRVKTYSSLKIKFFVKVKNKVHVTIGHVCDSARNYGPAQNDFKVKILWCVMEFVLSNTQMTDNIFTNNFIYFVWNSIVRISFDAIFCLVTFVTFWCNVLFVTFLI